MLLAIDPGNATGWALFSTSGELIECGLSSPAKWITLVTRVAPWKPDVLIEEPTLYQHSKANPASVMALQLKVGELKGRFESAGCTVRLVQPRTWKGQVPKLVHNQRTLKALSDTERALCEGARHDTLDAIGLGLWALKRVR